MPVFRYTWLSCFCRLSEPPYNTHTTHSSCICRLETLYDGQFMLSTQLMVFYYPVILSHRRSTTVSLETYPLSSFLRSTPVVVLQRATSIRDLIISKSSSNLELAVSLSQNLIIQNIRFIFIFNHLLPRHSHYHH